MKTFTWLWVLALALGLATVGLAAEENLGQPLTGEESAPAVEPATPEEAAPAEEPAAEDTAAKEEEGKKFQELVGTVQEINVEKNWLKVSKLEEAEAAEGKAAKPMEFAINDKTSIMDRGQELSLSDLTVGRQVKISYEAPLFGFIGKHVAHSIECQ